MSRHGKSKHGRRGAPAKTAGVWLYGRHAVGAALANPARNVHRLLATADSAGDLAALAPGRIETVDRRTLEGELGVVPHQGMAALCAPLPGAAIEDILPLMAPGRPLVLLDQVTDPQNVGAILRSACAFNAAGVVMQDRHAPPETGALAKAASGALDLLPLARVPNLARAIELAQKAGAWAIGLAGEAEMTLAEAVPRDRPALLALGAEGDGLRRLTRERCDALARLPIAPEMESLNVSAAAAVGLYALTGHT